MRWCLFLTCVWLVACSQEDGLNAGIDADAEFADASDAGADEDAGVADAAIPDPPQVLAPCEATVCRESPLGGPPCSTFSQVDDFVGEFEVHAYSSMVWDGALTNIRVTTTGGDWTPVIVLARLNGEVLFDGDIGAVRPPFQVTATSPADLVVETAQATGIVVYITSAAALASNFETSVPVGAAYELTIDSNCGGERLRCVVNGRDTGEPACGWLHYVGKRVVTRIEGTREQRLAKAARVAWWSLKEGLLALDNPIANSSCDGTMIEPLEDCARPMWPVGLSGVNAQGADVDELEELAGRLYGGAMPSGVLRTTANEAGLARDAAAAVMQTTGGLRASWLLRNSAIGFVVQERWVTRTCLDAAGAECTGSLSGPSRMYASDRPASLRSIDSLQDLFDQMID